MSAKQLLVTARRAFEHARRTARIICRSANRRLAFRRASRNLGCTEYLRLAPPTARARALAACRLHICGWGDHACSVPIPRRSVEHPDWARSRARRSRGSAMSRFVDGVLARFGTGCARWRSGRWTRRARTRGGTWSGPRGKTRCCGRRGGCRTAKSEDVVVRSVVGGLPVCTRSTGHVEHAECGWARALTAARRPPLRRRSRTRTRQADMV